MTRYIAFLRAINVGGHTVKMDILRGLFESLGFKKVETFIASGNVIFETKAGRPAGLEKKIADHLEKALGYEVDTFIRGLDELTGIVKRCPFAPVKKDDAVYVSFLHEPLSAVQESTMMALKNKLNDFAVIRHEIYWLRLRKDDSIFLKRPLEKTLNISATLRNMTTVSNIAATYA